MVVRGASGLTASDLDQTEQRANAFAAHFLAPPDAVRATIRALSPSSDEAINAVCRRFQIGRVTAVNQITNAFRLSKEERLDDRRSAVPPQQHLVCWFAPARAVRTGFCAAMRLRRGLQAAGEAASNSSSSDPLPAFGTLTEEQRAPVHTPEQRALLAAHRYLAKRADLGGYSAAHVLPERDQFRIEVEYADEKNWHAPVARGHLMLSARFEVVADSSLGVPVELVTAIMEA